MPLPEKVLIARLRKLAAPRDGRIIRGIGDDCAVLRPRPGEEQVVTTDLTLEDTHFRRDWHPPESVGHRCLARGLSDIAAMGAEPFAAFLSLALPPRLPQKWVDRFLRGFLQLAARYNVTLAGGDVAESHSGIVADVVAIGSVPLGRAIPRSGARFGDIIYVTGALGGSATTLAQLMKRGRPPGSARSAAGRTAGDRHFYPDPRIAVGRFLRANNLATSMIDLSDGLSTDLAHICEESTHGQNPLGASLVSALVPIAKGADLRTALHGGEDYELLFTARKSARVPVEIAGVPVTEIGWITKEKKLLLIDGARPPRKLEVKGWEHFRG